MRMLLGERVPSLFNAKWNLGRLKIENAFNAFQICTNLNANLKFAPKIVITYCKFHNFLIDKRESSGHEMDK